MLVDGFLELYRSGILRRKVYQDASLQRLVNEERIGENATTETEEVLAPYRKQGLFPLFPFGTDLTDEELTLQKALLVLKRVSEEHRMRVPRLTEVRKVLVIPDEARSYLERMELNQPRSIKERTMQRALVHALASINAI